MSLSWQRRRLSRRFAMAVLELADYAKARAAEILAQIAGVGMSADIADLVAPTLEGAAGAVCFAYLYVDTIDYINALGTGTVANDITEIKVVRMVFGDAARRLSISSIKSMHGHARREWFARVDRREAIRHGIVPPTISSRHFNAVASSGTDSVVAVGRLENWLK